ncbi:MAG: hypothetical protein BGO39_08070 [Chloroflexi bacterium 54-19]|nr:MAG: hypothetical protein BGO39_08070 [Chloroflexi bacterium 54-19]
MDSSILITKITPPQSQALLHRPRLQEALELVYTQNLLVISAPTGYGKTSLLLDFARTTPTHLAWYTLEETDRDPAVFCRYLLQSVRRAFIGFGQGFEALLDQNVNELQSEAFLRRMADEFAHELELLQVHTTKPAFQMLLVLDDFQFAESQRVSWFLQRLIGILPGFVHLIIASRTQPKNLMLVRLLAKQKVSFLSPQELAFTEEEIGQLLAKFYDIEQPEKLAATLAGYSEGWITAIILLLNAQGSTRLNWAARNQVELRPTELGFEALFDYLALEVFENLEPGLQNFLVKSAVLTWLTPENCANLWDEQNRAAVIERCRHYLHQLNSINLFITRHQLENGDLAYQYHNLFGRFLQAQLKKDFAEYRKTHYRAALVEQEAGNNVEAVRHLGEAGEPLKAISLLNEIAQSLYAAGRTGLLAELLEQLPQVEQEDFPHLLNVKARLLLEQGDNQAALKKYSQAVEAYEKARLFDWAAKATADKAQLLLRMGQFWEAQAESHRVITNSARLMQTDQGKQAVASARLAAGVVAIEQSRGIDAEKNLREAVDLYRELGDTFRLAVIDTYFGHLYHHQGRMVKSTIYYERSLHEFIRNGNRSREAYSRTNLANNYYIQHRYQPAEEMLQEALALTAELKDQYLSLFLQNILANIFRDTSRYSKAMHHYEEALKLARQGQVRKMELIILHDRATSHILQSHFDEAVSQIQYTLELTAEYSLPNQAGYSYRNQAWLEYCHRAYRRSLLASEKALVIFEESNSPLEQASVLLSQAATWHALLEQRKALAALNHALEVAEDLGFEPFLPFELRWANRLLEFAAGRKVTPLVESFLRRHGFISNLELPPQIQIGDYMEARPVLAVARPAPTRFEEEFQAPTGGLTIFGLDGGRVWRGGEEIKHWRNAKSREALFYILEHASCSRDELIDALFEDDEEIDTTHALHNILFLLRKSIAPVELKLQAQRYFLKGEVWYDAKKFTTEVTAALASRELQPERLAAALQLYRRDYLDQLYSNWVIERQRYLLELYLKGLKRLAEYHQGTRDYAQAVLLWKQILLKDPYNEEAYRAEITCLLALNNKPEALRQYTQCVKALEELDLQPSLETRSLLQKLA